MIALAGELLDIVKSFPARYRTSGFRELRVMWNTVPDTGPPAGLCQSRVSLLDIRATVMVAKPPCSQHEEQNRGREEGLCPRGRKKTTPTHYFAYSLKRMNTHTGEQVPAPASHTHTDGQTNRHTHTLTDTHSQREEPHIQSCRIDRIKGSPSNQVPREGAQVALQCERADERLPGFVGEKSTQSLCHTHNQAAEFGFTRAVSCAA